MNYFKYKNKQLVEKNIKNRYKILREHKNLREE